jgi:iron complex outermembrane recepter protein
MGYKKIIIKYHSRGYSMTKSTEHKLIRSLHKRSENSFKLSLFSVAFLSALVAPSALAQTVSSEAEALRTLERIVVTAEKFEGSVQDTGLVVNSFSSEELLAAGVDNIDGIVSLIPNVQLLDATGGGVPVVFIRGVGLADFRVNNSPAAAFYVDEVYKPSVAMMASSFFDLQRVEVLKGPQGGLYGRNANAGAVQIISAKASLSGDEGYLDMGLGRFGQVELESAVNVLLSDNLAMRVSGRRVTSDDTYMRSIENSDTASNTLLGAQKHGEKDVWATRAQFYYEPTLQFDATLKLFAGADKSDTTLLRPIGLWAGGDEDNDGFADNALANQLCAPLLQGRRDDSQCATITGKTPEQLNLRDEFDTTSSTINQVDNEWQGLTLSMNYRMLNDVELTSITHLESFKHARPTDWDAVAGSYQDFHYKTDIAAFSQELRLGYHANDWRFFGGVNIAKEELDEDTRILGDKGLIPLGFGHTEVHQRYAQEVDSYAVFGRVDYALTNQLNIISELRYTKEEKSFAGLTKLRNPVGTNDPSQEMLLVDSSQPNASFDDVSGKVTLNYKVHRNLLTYISASRGFKSGGFPGGLVLSTAGAAKYDAETINGYELGFKSDTLNQRLRLNASVFYYDYSNLQGSARVPATGGVTLDRFQNIGDAEVYGFDAEMTYLLDRNWLIQGMFGHSEGQITNSIATQLSPLTGEEFSLQGKELNYKPDFSMNLMIRRDFNLQNGYSGYAQLAYDWRSAQNFTYIGNLAEQAIFTEDSYGLVNIQIGMSKLSSDWHFSVFVNNLTDERFRTNARADDLGGAFEIYGAPRQWGIKANYQF